MIHRRGYAGPVDGPGSIAPSAPPTTALLASLGTERAHIVGLTKCRQGGVEECGRVPLHLFGGAWEDAVGSLGWVRACFRCRVAALAVTVAIAEPGTWTVPVGDPRDVITAEALGKAHRLPEKSHSCRVTRRDVLMVAAATVGIDLDAFDRLVLYGATTPQALEAVLTVAELQPRPNEPDACAGQRSRTLRTRARQNWTCSSCSGACCDGFSAVRRRMA